MDVHKERAHARLGASDAERWLNCTPAVVAEEQLLKTKPLVAELDDDTRYSIEGTAAHEVLETKLQFRTDLRNAADGPAKKLAEQTFTDLRKELQAKYGSIYDEEMERCTNDATRLVMEQIDTLAAEEDQTPAWAIEKRLPFDRWVPDGFGTVDVVIIGRDTIIVIDFKYGRGIMKFASGNPQMRLYALGVLQSYETARKVRFVKTIIIQPRLDHFSVESIDKADLIQWATEIVEPKAIQADQGLGTLQPGSWCQWCKASAHCRALADHHLELARDEFGDEFPEIDLLTDAEILTIYNKLDDFGKWVKAIKDHVFDTAMKGQKWAGYKLVEGRTKRQITDNDGAIKTLIDDGDFFDYEVSNLKIKPFGELEKLMSKDRFDELVGPFISKTDPAPTIAPESDKRAEYGLASAVREFSEPIEDEEL